MCRSLAVLAAVITLSLGTACDGESPTVAKVGGPDRSEGSADVGVAILDATRDSVRIFNGTTARVAIQLWDRQALATANALPCSAAGSACPTVEPGATRSFPTASVAFFSLGTADVSVLWWSYDAAGQRVLAAMSGSAWLPVPTAPLPGPVTTASGGSVTLAATADSIIVSNGTTLEIRYVLLDAADLPLWVPMPCTTACARVPAGARLAIARATANFPRDMREVVLTWWSFSGTTRLSVTPVMTRALVR